MHKQIPVKSKMMDKLRKNIIIKINDTERKANSVEHNVRFSKTAAVVTTNIFNHRKSEPNLDWTKNLQHAHRNKSRQKQNDMGSVRSFIYGI